MMFSEHINKRFLSKCRVVVRRWSRINAPEALGSERGNLHEHVISFAEKGGFGMLSRATGPLVTLLFAENDDIDMFDG